MVWFHHAVESHQKLKKEMPNSISPKEIINIKLLWFSTKDLNDSSGEDGNGHFPQVPVFPI